MKDIIDFAIFSFTSLFIIVDPIGLTPAFLVMTRGNTLAEKVRMAASASLLTFFILCGCAACGLWIFDLFGITMPAFEIAGGIILLIIALDMLQARRTAVKETREEQEEGIEKEDIAVTPLAVPMLAGPGAITTVIILSSKTTQISERVTLASSIFAVSILTFLTLFFAAKSARLFGAIAMRILTRLMGLLLSSVAIQFILNGLIHSGLFS